MSRSYEGEPTCHREFDVVPRNMRSSCVAPRAFQKWSRYNVGPCTPVMSELTEACALEIGDGLSAYLRPANRRDIGHRCQRCRQTFNILGEPLVAQCASNASLKSGPTNRLHEECWRRPSETSKATRSTWRSEDLPLEYADSWRRSRTNSEVYSGWTPILSKASRETPIISGVHSGYSVEDAAGQRRISCRFSISELAEACQQWACNGYDVEEECAICYGKSNRALRLPCTAGHVFCVDCVTPWLQLCSLCPTCRFDLRQTLKRPLSAPPSPRFGGAGITKSNQTPRFEIAGITKPVDRLVLAGGMIMAQLSKR